MKFSSYATAAVIAISGAFASSAASAADAYPTRSIMLVIPFPPGGGTDIVGRLLANKLGAALGKAVVVENRPGAGSAIGAGFVAQANPDGYTLLLASGSPLIVAPLFSKTTYDPVKSFAPICLMASSPFVLSVSPTVPVKTVEELIALARAKPGQLNMASFGQGSSSHITGEMFKSMAHVDMVHVPYKGSVPAITELMGGQVQVMFDVLSSALPYYKAGKLHILAVTGTKRSSILPEVPVLADTLPGFESSTWFGVVAPAGTPAPIVARLNTEIIKALADPEVRKVLDEQSLEPIGSTPEQFAQKIDTEIVKWRKVINDAGVKAVTVRPHLSPLEVIRSYESHRSTLNSLLDSRAAVDADRPFIVFRERTTSWREFADARDRASRMLLARGVRKGDRVALMAENHDAHVLMLFALARIGAILVPVNPKFGVEETRYALTHAQVSAVFCTAQTYEIALPASSEMAVRPWFCSIDGEESSRDISQLDALLKDAGNDALPEDASPDDTCVIVYSSGTTGFPKGVMHSQRSVVLCAERQIARVHLQPGDRCMCVLPMFHVNALFYSIAGVVAAGCCLVIVEKFSASRFWETVAATGTTQVNLLMAMSMILARRPRTEFVGAARARPLRCVSGSPFTRETMDVFLNEFGVERVIEGFGMTEIPGAFSNPYEGPHKLASMGWPGTHPDPEQPWTQARVVDDQGADVEDGTTGELVVVIPTIMQGYLHDAEQTTAAFRDGWFMTGDLVYRDPEGCFFFVSRKKDVIRRRGENIAGAELDRVIGEHPNVLEVAAIAVPSELGEDEIMAVVVRRPGADLAGPEIRDWCAQRLAAHKVPRFVVFVDELPHTPTHKVAKFELRSDKALRARAVDYQPPVARTS